MLMLKANMFAYYDMRIYDIHIYHLMCNCILILNKYLLIRILYVYIRKKIVNKCIVKNKRFYYKI